MDSTFTDRVAERAESIKILRLVLSLLAVPFYVVGFGVALVWLAVRWCYAAVCIGWTDAKGRWVNDDAG